MGYVFGGRKGFIAVKSTQSSHRSLFFVIAVGVCMPLYNYNMRGMRVISMIQLRTDPTVR